MPISRGVAAFLCLTALLLLGFGNTLTPYFHCDDFLHTAYLYRVFHSDFWLLGTNFFSSWLQDRSFYNFFRPLTEVSLALDYWLYEGQARGYHLTNLLLHLVNCVLVFKLTATLARRYELEPGKTCFLNAFFAAILFATLGTHSEAVAWVLSRSDLVCTAFYLASLLCFLKGSRIGSGRLLFQFLAAASFSLALLAKEMAVSLPFVLTLFTLTSPGLKLKPRQIWKEVGPYFLLLAFYLLWRSLSIGTIYGSYSGSLGEIMRASMWERWFLSDELLQFFHPFNIDIIGQDSPLRTALRLVFGACGLLVLMIFLSGRSPGRREKQLNNRSALIFALLAFTLLAALPSLQILGVTANMTGGRIAYLPSVPAVMALSFGVLLPDAGSRAAQLLRPAGILLLSLLTCINTIAVRLNNQAWQAAGEVIAKIGSDLNKQTEALQKGQKLVVFNLPDEYKGAHCFTTRGTLEGLLKPPLQETDLSQKIEALDFQPLYSGFISYHDYSLARSRPDKYKVLYYDAVAAGLRPLPQPIYKNKSETQASITPVGVKETIYEADSAYKKSRTYCYNIAPPLTPDQFQMLEVDYQVPAKSKERAPENSYLFVDWQQNQSKSSGKASRRPYIELSKAINQRVFLPLSGYKDWQVTQAIDRLYLTITEIDEREAAPPKLRLLKEAQVAPIITNAAFSNMEMPPTGLEINYDISGMKDFYHWQEAHPSLFLEVGKAYCYSYHYQKRPQDSTPLKAPLLVQKLSAVEQGSFKLSPSQLGKEGCYQVRLLVMDRKGVLGAASQPLFITVKP